ncbi:hypothetical protein ACFYXS_02430 [Streptomyces sp. NPDC002574]|uniref:hypothetical protein n=1 Tax=Streptomyces sp. NPDC002574 TaxID=3364652 RepID=UPI0036C701D8
MGWRLVGANNRELGRSARVYASLAECQAAVLRLRENIGQVRAQLAMADAGSTWTWRVALGGKDVAVSGRTYQRQRECQQNLGLFLAAVTVAEMTEGTAHRPRLRGLRAAAQPGSTREDSDDGRGAHDARGARGPRDTTPPPTGLRAGAAVR